MDINQNKQLLNMLLAIGLVMGFIFIVSTSIYFIQETLMPGCACKYSIPIIIAVLTSLGVFVGVLTYYFLSKSFIKEKKKIYVNAEKTLDFLEPEEKKIVLALINNKGECIQSLLAKITGINPVKLHRRLHALESKGIIAKKKNGMTNKLYLHKDYIGLFIN